MAKGHKLSDAAVADMVKRRKAGQTAQQIADHYKVATQTVHNRLKGVRVAVRKVAKASKSRNGSTDNQRLRRFAADQALVLIRGLERVLLELVGSEE